MRKKSKSRAKPWKKHKQVVVALNCGVRVEVDKNIARLLVFLNNSGIETRHSCEGKTRADGYSTRAYISMFATPQALGLAQYLLIKGGELGLVLERDIHPKGYENLVIRWSKKDQKKFEALIRNYFS